MDIKHLAGQEFDEYKLIDLIGQGGMSAVYRAYQEELNRYVAFKLLDGQVAQEGNYTGRFIHEAKIAASLEHPNIVPIYDYGTREGFSYVVMRLLTGGTLTDKMQRGGMKPAEVIRILESVSSALDYAHRRGIVHCDIKPSNIMFDEHGTVYLVDFGIARAMRAEASPSDTALGTPPYMSPEMWRDDPLTPAVDQYALAVIAYTILTGRQPFEASGSQGYAHKHLNEIPTPAHYINPHLHPTVNDVLQRALAKSPTQRYPSITNFSNALRQSLAAPYIPDHSLAAPQYIPPPAPPVYTAVPPPMPSTGARRRSSKSPAQQSGLFLQIVSGGAIGLILLFIVAVIIAIVAFSLLSNNSDTPPDAGEAENQAPTAEIQNETSTEAAAAPTLIPVGATAIGNIENGQILFSQLEITVRDVAFSPAGMIASAHADGVVRLWQNGVSANPTVLSGHTAVVMAVDFSANGTLLASAGSDMTVRLWDAVSSTALAVYSGHTGVIRDVAFSPDGTLLASASEDNTIRLWRIEDGSLLRTISTENRSLAIAFSPDGALLASAGSDVLIRIWDVATGALQRTLAGHTEEVRSVVFSPDAALLASSSLDNTIRIWDLSSGQTIHTLTEHANDVWQVTFSPDGTLLASGGRDNNARLWNVSTGEALATYTGHTGWVFAVDFSPDSTILVTGGGDGTVRLWRIEG